MGWCNDVRNKKYNKLIKIDKKIKHEKMFRRDYKYDYLKYHLFLVMLKENLLNF